MTAWTIPSYAEWAVPGYTEERLLGHGISGRVVAAENEATGRRVAIKYFDDNLARDPEFIGRYRADVERLRTLDAHHVARVFDYVEQPGEGAAVVTELLDGVSLREMIARKGPLSPPGALVAFKDMLLGLAAAHGRRVPHRDVKPDNMLVDVSGWGTLTDFGVAVKADKQLAAAGAPAYLAPELWNGAPALPASDLYAATAVLYEAVTGKPPFTGRLGQLRAQHESAPVALDRVDGPLRGLIKRGLAKNPADRPSSARSFLQWLDETAAAGYGPHWEDEGRRELAERAAAVLPLLAGGGGSSATETRRARRRLLAFAGAAAAAVVVLGAAGAVALSRMSDNAQLSSAAGSAFSAQVTVTPPVAASKCTTATAFAYHGTVTATMPGTVTYQWLYSSGKPGPVQTLRFTAAGDKTISGGTVKAVKAGKGWAELKMLTPVATTSDKATYQLLCGSGNGQLSLSAAVQPAKQTVSSCAATAAPHLTASGSITSTKAGTVHYYWALAGMHDSAVGTVTFTAPGTKAVPPLAFTAPALPASGEAVLVASWPVNAASAPAAYSVACNHPVTATPSTSATSATSGAATAPASAKASASTSASKSATASTSPSASTSTRTTDHRPATTPVQTRRPPDPADVSHRDPTAPTAHPTPPPPPTPTTRRPPPPRPRRHRRHHPAGHRVTEARPPRAAGSVPLGMGGRVHEDAKGGRPEPDADQLRYRRDPQRR